MHFGLGPLVSVLALTTACSGGSSPADAGPDGGHDAGPVLTDGGGIGAACTSLDQCGGNPLCTTQSCSFYVVCGNGACAAAGGAQTSETVKLGFAMTAASPLPTYIQVYALAPALVGSGTLDCPTLMARIDAGTLNPDNRGQVNPLFAAYEQAVTIQSASDILTFPTNLAASGTGRVLFIEGYLYLGQPDGGGQLLARACTTFDNTTADAGVALTLSSPW